MMPYRSAVTGEYVTTEFAAANPDTTVWEQPEDENTEPPPEDKEVDTDVRKDHL
jgi:hypothetical protein